MRRMLNTLYVTAEDAWLRKDGANIVVEVEGAERGRAPLHMLDGVVSFSRAGASPALLAACAEAGMAVSYLAPNGRFLARVEGARSGNVLLRRTQYRMADDPARALPIVRGIVAAKTANQRAVLRRALRDHAEAMEPSARNRLAAAEWAWCSTATYARLPPAWRPRCAPTSPPGAPPTGCDPGLSPVLAPVGLPAGADAEAALGGALADRTA